MFSSQSLLSKKGPLATIWLAAYFYRKLKREQVTQTNIVSSVDIIIPEVEISYRILAQLLLGVVRIYSKKVEYLYHDCSETLNEISKKIIPRHRHVVNRTAYARKAGSSATKAVAAVTDNVGSAHGNTVSAQPEFSPEERMLAPYHHLTISIPARFELDSFDLGAQEECPDASANQQSTLEAKGGSVGTKQLNSNENYLMDLFCDRSFNYAPFTPVEDILSCDVINVDNNMLDSLGILESTGGDLQSVIKPAAKNAFSGVKRRLNLIVDSNEDDSRNDMVNLNDIHTDLAVPKGQSITSTPTRAQGPVSPDFAVTTPAKKERGRFPTKRKCIFDRIIVLPNEVLKEWIHDSTGLMYKRRKAAQSSFDAWKACIFSDLQKAFVEPLIPSNPVQFKDQPVRRFTDSVSEQTVPNKLADINIGSDTARSELLRENETPFNENASSNISVPQRSIETQLVAEFDEEQEDTRQIDLSDKDADPPLEGANHKGCFSTRTRYVAHYLHKYFLNLKDRKQNEIARLDEISDGRKRSSCAKFFYEVLILKTNGYVDVMQEHPHGDITISPTAKLDQL